MKQAKQKSEFMVIKHSYTYQECLKCDGSGKIEFKHRKMIWIHDCPICKGEGRQRFTITEEVPLAEALHSIATQTELNTTYHK